MTSIQASGVAEKIRALREERGWSQRELARRVGVDPPAIHRLENSRGNLRIHTIQRLARAFQVEASVFLEASPAPLESPVQEEKVAPQNASEIAKKVRELREKSGWSQRELARRMGMEPSSLNRIENGTGNLHLQTLHRFARTFQVEPTAFLQVLDPPTPPASSKQAPETDERTPSLPTFGEKVRALRKQKGWTLDEMAKQTGLSAPYISQVERNDAGYSTDAAERIAEALHVDAMLLQHPKVDVENISEISLILQGLVGLPKTKLAVLLQMIAAMRQ